MSLKHRAKRAAKLRDYGHEFNREAIIAWGDVVAIRQAAGAARTRNHNAEKAAKHAAREG